MTHRKTKVSTKLNRKTSRYYQDTVSQFMQICYEEYHSLKVYQFCHAGSQERRMAEPSSEFRTSTALRYEIFSLPIARDKLSRTAKRVHTWMNLWNFVANVNVKRFLKSRRKTLKWSLQFTDLVRVSWNASRTWSVMNLSQPRGLKFFLFYQAHCILSISQFLKSMQSSVGDLKTPNRGCIHEHNKKN